MYSLPPEGAQIALGRPGGDLNMTPSIQTLPRDLHTLADHEAAAQQRLSSQAWAYFSGGAADEVTLRANQQQWASLTLAPRVLQSLSNANTQCRLMGKGLLAPILVAPMAYQCMAHADGELATALAASAQGAGMVLSTQASVSLESVAQAVRADATRGPLWFQLYLQTDSGVTLDLVKRAELAGYEALVITVDAPCSGVRDRERRAGFALPEGISAVNLAPYGPQASTTLDQAPTWDSIAWLQTRTRLPIVLKGILHVDDARQAARINLAGVIVSNHGGRTLDTVPTASQVLPGIAQAVAADMVVLADGGIRRGTDVLKALALGAHAVLLGRPVLHGLTNAGAQGVAHVLRVLRDELEIAMALCGCASTSGIATQAHACLLYQPAATATTTATTTANSLLS